MWFLENKKEGATAPPCPTRKKVLLLIDWDNVFLCLYAKFKLQIQLERRIENLMQWVQKEVGEILEGYGFVFAPEHLTYFHQRMCEKNNLKLITCPKRQLEKSKKNPKTGKMSKDEDTVDETLMWFGNLMLRHPDVGFLCIATGDNDYIPLMEEAKKQGVKRALVPPTIDSLSRSKNLVRLADKHPISQRKMILVLDEL